MRRRAALLLAAALTAVGALITPLSSGAVQNPRISTPWAPMKGIAVDLAGANQLSDAAAMHQGAILFSAIRNQFHANAVSLNFPFWQLPAACPAPIRAEFRRLRPPQNLPAISASCSSDPEAGPTTPSPARLEMLTLLAQQYGLSVQYRPYLYEKNLWKYSRPSIVPANVPAWFHSYRTFLQPYLVSAAQAGAASFSIALEFTTLLPYLSQWEQLVTLAKSEYPGPILYSQQHIPEATIPGTDRGYDAYQPVCPAAPTVTFTTVGACHGHGPARPTVSAFARGFIHNLQMAGMQSAPSDLTIEELGIPAVATAYLRPNFFLYPPSTRVVPAGRAVQTDWFAGACRAFYALHLAGIYFWSINFDGFSATENDNAKIYPWVGTPTANAIASCFARPT